MRRALAPLLVLALLVSGCTFPEPESDSSPGGPSDGLPTVFGPCDEPVSGAPPLVASIVTRLGIITVQLANEAAPTAVQSFVDLARDGFYDGMVLARVGVSPRSAPNGTLVRTQVASPPTEDAGTEESASPEANTRVAHEIHPDLQFDAPGVVGFLGGTPDNVTRNIAITLIPVRSLDGKSPVFGHVIEGMDVVRRIGNETSAGENAASENVTIETIRIATGEIVSGASALVLRPERKAGAGRPTVFLVIGTNTGNARDRIHFEVAPPTGWTGTFDLPCATVVAGANRVSILTLTPEDEDTEGGDVVVRVRSDRGASNQSTARVEVGRVGAPVANGTTFEGNFIGLLEDGRLFDTSLKRAASDPAIPKASWFRERPTYTIAPFMVGSGAFEGFLSFIEGTRAEEAAAGRYIPGVTGPDNARGPVAGKTVVLLVEVVIVH